MAFKPSFSLQNILPLSLKRFKTTQKKKNPENVLQKVLHNKENHDEKTLRKESEYTQEEPEIVTHKGEVKDSTLVFEIAWNNLVDRFGDENMTFPKDIMFLAGAPGAGKGEMTDFIMKTRGITTEPIETSQLLKSEEAEAMKAKGELVADRHVVQLVLQKLLDPSFSSGVIVDGFPRTKVQGECIKHLYDKMRDYKRKYESTQFSNKFRRPIFHITLLFIEEDQSVERQISRGNKVKAHNKRVKETGVGSLIPVRPTDSDPELARLRYRQFKDNIYESLQSVKDHFAFHFISADATPQIVKRRILKELEYQSSLELNEITFEKVRQLPLASEIVKNARFNLVRRLDLYCSEHPELFKQVIDILQNDFFNIIKLQALSGKVVIRSENPVFDQDPALTMALDLFTERGFRAVLDFHRRRYPQRIESDGLVVLRERRVYEFHIEFAPPQIRHFQRFLA